MKLIISFSLYSPPSRYSSDERDEIESLDDDIQSMKLQCGLGFWKYRKTFD